MIKIASFQSIVKKNYKKKQKAEKTRPNLVN